jgi:hypothetical protein
MMGRVPTARRSTAMCELYKDETMTDSIVPALFFARRREPEKDAQWDDPDELLKEEYDELDEDEEEEDDLEEIEDEDVLDEEDVEEEEEVAELGDETSFDELEEEEVEDDDTADWDR